MVCQGDREENQEEELKNPVYSEDYMDGVTRCAICLVFAPNKDLEEVNVDELGNKQGVCISCREKRQT